MLQANWNRPLMALLMICITVTVCVFLTQFHKWKV